MGRLRGAARHEQHRHRPDQPQRRRHDQMRRGAQTAQPAPLRRAEIEREQADPRGRGTDAGDVRHALVRRGRLLRPAQGAARVLDKEQLRRVAVGPWARSPPGDGGH